MGHAARKLNQTLNTTQALGQGEDLGELAETLGSGVAAADAERQHSTAHAVAVLLEGNLTVRVRVKAGVVDGNDVGGSLERLSNGGGIAGCLTGTQMQGLQTTVSQPRVECRGDSTNCVLQETQAGLEVIAVESSDTHDNIAVAVDVLGDTVDDDVGAKIEGVLDVR